MSFTSTGYDGSVNEAVWGATAPYYGSDPGVLGVGDLRVSLAGDNLVSVAAGVAYGWGITDRLTVPEALPLERPTDGRRYDAIVARRDWTTNTTTLTVVAGGSERIVPPLRSNPGESADQALALVHVTPPGNPLVVTDDLRVTQAPVGVAQSLAAMRGPVGSRWVLASTGRRYMIGVAGTPIPEWVAPLPPLPQVPIIGCGTAAVNTNQYGSATIQHGLGWTPTSATLSPRLATSSGMVECYVSSANGLTSTTMNVTCKVRTSSGMVPYEGALTYLDWVATRPGTTEAIVVPTPDGNVTTPGPAPSDGSTPADPGGDGTPPLTSGGGSDTVPTDVDVGSAPQTPVSDIPPIYAPVPGEPTTDVNAVARILATAAAEIGVRESPTGSNKVKYWLAEKPAWNGSAWCACFTAWVYRRHGISVNTVLAPKDNNPYYTPYLESAAKGKGLWYTGTPRPGDMVIYGGSANTHAVHVEIVEKWIPETGRVQTIGGNTSDGLNGSPSNGGGVYRNRRNPRSSSLPIRGYIKMPTATPVALRVKGPFPLPAGHYYGAADAGTSMEHDGSVAGDRQAISQIQAEVGTAVDGLFGPQTAAAVRAWQVVAGRTATGRVTVDDWSALSRVAAFLPRPTGVTAAGGDRSVTVSFSPVAGATYYQVATSTTPVIRKDGPQSPITLTGLTPGQRVAVVVYALNSTAHSEPSPWSNDAWPVEGNLATVATLDGTVFPVIEGSSRTPLLLQGVNVVVKDAAQYSTFTAQRIPAARITPGLQQAARNICTVLYDGTTKYPWPANRQSMMLSFDGNSAYFQTNSGAIAYALFNKGEVHVGPKGNTTANCGSWITHEMVHLYQGTSSNSHASFSGVIEGIADYVLVRIGYREPWAPQAGDAWDDGYMRTASFFKWIEDEAPTKSPNFVRDLNQQLKQSSWTPSRITSINARGMTVEALWAEFYAAKKTT